MIDGPMTKRTSLPEIGVRLTYGFHKAIPISQTLNFC